MSENLSIPKGSLEVPIGLISHRPITWYNSFNLTEELGSGTYSHVYLYEWNEKRVALKKITSYYYINDTFLIELSLLTSLSHPNIISLIDAFIIQKDSFIGSKSILVMPFADRGNLSIMIKKGYIETEQEKKSACIQILRAIIYLHGNDILHGDIKAENILVFSEYNDVTKSIELKYVVSDFGIARSDKCFDNFGCSESFTLPYKSPEILLGRKYEKKADSWALGILFVEIITRVNVIFNRNNNNDFTIPDTIRNIFKLFGTPNEETWPEIIKNIEHYTIYLPKEDLAKEMKLTEEQYGFISKLLVVNPNNRSLPRDVYNDPWLDSVRDTNNNTNRDKSTRDILLSREATPVGRLTLSVKNRYILQVTQDIWSQELYKRTLDIEARDIILGTFLFERYAKDKLQDIDSNLKTAKEYFFVCLVLAGTLYGGDINDIPRLIEMETDILVNNGPDLLVATSYEMLEYILEEDGEKRPYKRHNEVLDEIQRNGNVARTFLNCCILTRISELHRPSVIAMMCYILACLYCKRQIRREILEVSNEGIIGCLIVFIEDIREIWTIPDNSIKLQNNSKRRKLDPESRHIREEQGLPCVDTDDILLNTQILSTGLGIDMEYREMYIEK